MKVNVPLATLGLLPYDGWVELDFIGATIGDMIADVDRRYPGFASWCLPEGHPLKIVSFRINGKVVGVSQGVDMPVSEGDTIKLISYHTMSWNM